MNIERISNLFNNSLFALIADYENLKDEIKDKLKSYKTTSLKTFESEKNDVFLIDMFLQKKAQLLYKYIAANNRIYLKDWNPLKKPTISLINENFDFDENEGYIVDKNNLSLYQNKLENFLVISTLLNPACKYEIFDVKNKEFVDLIKHDFKFLVNYHFFANDNLIKLLSWKDVMDHYTLESLKELKEDKLFHNNILGEDFISNINDGLYDSEYFNTEKYFKNLIKHKDKDYSKQYIDIIEKTCAIALFENKITINKIEFFNKDSQEVYLYLINKILKLNAEQYFELFDKDLSYTEANKAMIEYLSYDNNFTKKELAFFSDKFCEKLSNHLVYRDKDDEKNISCFLYDDYEKNAAYIDVVSYYYKNRYSYDIKDLYIEKKNQYCSLNFNKMMKILVCSDYITFYDYKNNHDNFKYKGNTLETILNKKTGVLEVTCSNNQNIDVCIQKILSIIKEIYQNTPIDINPFSNKNNIDFIKNQYQEKMKVLDRELFLMENLSKKNSSLYKKPKI